MRARPVTSAIAGAAAIALGLAVALTDASAGKQDPGFGSRGSYSFPLDGEVVAIAPQVDGRVVFVIGDFQSYLARVLPDGRPDPTFGRQGIATGLSEGGGVHYARATAAVDAAGRIVIGQQTALSRRLSDGRLDPSFGTNGRVDVGSPISGVAVAPDGAIVVALERYDQEQVVDGEVLPAAVLARFLPDGSPDQRFGVGGRSPLAVLGPARVAVQPDGAIVVAGRVLPLTRYHADGTPDRGFGSNGGVPLEGLHGDELALGRDGSIFVAGLRRGGDTVVAHVLGDGSLDTAFGTGGLSVKPFRYGFPLALAALPTGGVALAGLGSRGSAYKGSWALQYVLSPDGTWQQVKGGPACPIDPDQDEWGYDSATAVAVDATGKILFGGNYCMGATITRYLPTLELDAGPPLTLLAPSALGVSAAGGGLRLVGRLTASGDAHLTVLVSRPNRKWPCENGPPLWLLPGSGVGGVRLERPGWRFEGDLAAARATSLSLALRRARAIGGSLVIHLLARDDRQRWAQLHLRVSIRANHATVRTEPLDCA